MAGEVGTGGPIGEKGDPGDRGESSEETGRKVVFLKHFLLHFCLCYFLAACA